MKARIEVLGVLPLLLMGAATLGCGGEAGTGSVTALLEAEDVIIEGIEPGDGLENIRDGWAVSFDRYIATVGDLDLHFSSNHDIEAEGADVFVVDLTEVPSAGLDLWQLDGLRAGRWDFYYATPSAADDATRHSSVSEADFDDDDFRAFAESRKRHVPAALFATLAP